MGLKRIGYIRVSTSKGEQLSALERQRHQIEAAGVDEVVEDVQSGRESDRVGYQYLLEQIAARRVSELVITRVDRLGRDAADTDTVIAFCAKHNVTITALQGGEIESITPEGFFMSRILTTMAEVESRMLSLRVRKGLTAAREQHRPVRGRAPWGYRVKSDKSSLEPHPIEFERATQFIALLRNCEWRMNTALTKWEQQGLGDIPLHSCRSVRAWLLNPVIRGGLGYGQVTNHQYNEIVWNTHEPLLSHEEFSTVERYFQQNKRMWGANHKRTPRLLTGLCVCAHCRKTMCYAGGRTVPSVLCKTRNCPQQYRSTHEEVVKKAIIKAIRAKAEALAGFIEEEPEELSRLRSEIERLQAMDDPDLTSAIESKQRRMRELHKSTTPDPVTVELLSRPRTWTHLTPDELRELFVQLVSAVEIGQQRVQAVRLRI